MDRYMELLSRKSELERKVNYACENVEPKSWPYTNREYGAYLIPLMDQPPHVGILNRKNKLEVAASISLPGGKATTDSPRSTMLEQASEEMGIDPEDIEVMGYLCLYPLKDVEYDAHIFVGWTPPMEEWKLDAEEIDRAFKIPLEYFLEEYNSTRFDLRKPGFSFQVGEEDDDVCSLNTTTARIMSTLIRRIG